MCSSDLCVVIDLARMPNPPKSMTTQLPLRTAEEIVYLAAAVVVAIGGS